MSASLPVSSFNRTERNVRPDNEALQPEKPRQPPQILPVYYRVITAVERESVSARPTLQEQMAQRSKLGFQSSPLRRMPRSCGQSPLHPGPDVHTQS